MIYFDFEEIPPTESHLLKNHYFGLKKSKQEFVDQLLLLENTGNKVKGGIGSATKGATIDNSIRDVDISKIIYPGNEKIYKSVINVTNKINREFFGFKISALEELCLLTYGINGHYVTHIDTSYSKLDCRKLTFLLGLSEINSYDGGELLLYPNSKSQVKYKIHAGDLLIFPTYVPHKVEPVTSGVRKMIVTWFWGEKFK